MKTILVTGGAGFIGSNFVRYMLKNYEDITLVNLDLLTYAGNLDNLVGVSNDKRYTFVRGDIHDGALVEQLFEKYGFDTVVNFAAESHVDRSITNPDIFMTTNVMGTLTLLDTAKRHWKLDPDDKYSRDFREGVLVNKFTAKEVKDAIVVPPDEVEAHLAAHAPSGPRPSRKAIQDRLRAERFRRGFRRLFRALYAKADVKSPDFPELETLEAVSPARPEDDDKMQESK